MTSVFKETHLIIISFQGKATECKLLIFKQSKILETFLFIFSIVYNSQNVSYTHVIFPYENIKKIIPCLCVALLSKEVTLANI